MLDDLKMFHERDAQDMLGTAAKQWQQIQQTFEITNADGLSVGDVSNIVCLGVGSSALAADLYRVWPGSSVPLEVCRSYEMPAYVNERTLVVAISYSGTTEEVLLALRAAEDRKAKIAVVTSGGELASHARDQRHAMANLPPGLPARYALWLSFGALLKVIGTAGVSTAGTDEQVFGMAANWLKQETTAWLPTTPVARNLAKQIALEVVGKSAVIYSGPLLASAAYRWKMSLNENAKHVAWRGQYPEFSYNELLGWTRQPVSKPYTVIDIRSDLEHPRVQRYFEVSEQLLSGVRPAPLVVRPAGETLLHQLLYTCVLGDFVSIYVALAGGINPTPVDIVERLRKEVI